MKYTRWSEERAAQLGRLHAKDFSFGQIAAELGMSRGAVASKVAQMGLAGRPRGARSKSVAQAKKRTVLTSKDHGAFMQALDAVEPTADLVALMRTTRQSDAPVALLDLEPHHCRWPVRDMPYLFCADTKTDGSSYCSRHFSISRRI